MANDCIFCKIAQGELPATKIYENEQLLAFLDLFPANPGHTLIIPKRHSDDILQALPEDIAAVGRLSVPLAKAVFEASAADGLGVHQLNKAAAGQTVFHYHMHLIPQIEGKGLQLHGRSMAEQADLEAMAAKIRSRLEV